MAHPTVTLDEVIPYWEKEMARWRRHAARFAALAAQAREDDAPCLPWNLRRPAYIDLRYNRYSWFNHMAALYGAWAARAEQRLKVLQTRRTEPS